MHSVVQRSSCGRPRIYIRGRLRQQSHTDLPSRWDIPPGFRMLGIRGRGVQRIGRDRCHVQWQYSSMRQREPPHSSFLNTPAASRFVRLSKVIFLKLKLKNHFKTFDLHFLLCFWNMLFPSLASYTRQCFHFVWFVFMSPPPLSQFLTLI